MVSKIARITGEHFNLAIRNFSKIQGSNTCQTIKVMPSA